jgi:hypothetical protein
MSEKTRVELTRLQGGIAIASFCIGAIISLVCLFVIPPLGEISNSALFAAGNFLVMCGGVLGVKASTEVRMNKMEAQYRNIMNEMPKHADENDRDGIINQ